MKILIAVDDSPFSQAAVDYVRKAKWPDGTRVTVLAVARPPVGAYAEVYAPGPEYLQRVIEEEVRVSEEFTTRIEREFKRAGLAADARVVQGDPREGIIDTARSIGADLIVVGSHGRTGLSKLLMGSVASHVVAHAPCSVLVVKSPAKNS